MMTWTKVKLIAVYAAAAVLVGVAGMPSAVNAIAPDAVRALAQEKKPAAEKQYAATVEITEPSAFTGVKDTRFVLTKDISVPRAGAMKFKQCEHIEIDLGGHTVTYNTEDYNPKKEWGSGLNVSYSRDVVIRNGTIVQAEMDPVKALGVGYTDDVVIDGLNIIVRRALRDREKGGVTPMPTAAINIYRYGGAIKKVPPRDAYKNVIRNCYLENGGMGLNEVYDYEIANNVLVNGHGGIAVRGPLRPEAGRRGAKHKIHHNLIQSLRVVGWKSPNGMYLAAGRECEVYENKVASDDARGLISSGNGLEKNVFHHNEISARYASASAIGYVDNRPYGIWTRNSWGCEFHHNRILVINSSPFEGGANYGIGIHCAKYIGQGPDNDEFTIRDNIITVMHDFANQTSTGISFGPGSIGIFGKNETIRNNVIRAQTIGFKLDAEYFDPDSGNICNGNVVIKPGKHDAGWRGTNLTLPDGNRIEDEKPDKNAPAAPTGLKIRNHMGRAIIEWKWNAEDDVVGYWIYKNGARIPGTRFRGATFYIDVAPADGDRYSVSAQDFSGNEGARCAEVVFNKVRTMDGRGARPRSSPRPGANAKGLRARKNIEIDADAEKVLVLADFEDESEIKNFDMKDSAKWNKTKPGRTRALWKGVLGNIWNAGKLELSTEHVLHGKRSMKVHSNVRTDDRKTGHAWCKTAEDSFPPDWSGYDALRFFIHWPEEADSQWATFIWLRFKDAEGKDEWIQPWLLYTMKQGDTEVEIPLAAFDDLKWPGIGYGGGINRTAFWLWKQPEKYAYLHKTGWQFDRVYAMAIGLRGKYDPRKPHHYWIDYVRLVKWRNRPKDTKVPRARARGY